MVNQLFCLSLRRKKKRGKKNVKVNLCLMRGIINMLNAIARWFLWSTTIIYFQLIPFPPSLFTGSTTLTVLKEKKSKYEHRPTGKDETNAGFYILYCFTLGPK